MALSRRLRFEILRRDNHTCRYCGATSPDAKITVDHVVPVALGGSDDPANLVAACVDCNAGKSATPPDSPTVQDVQQSALRWAAALQRAAEDQLREFKEREDERRELGESFECKWASVWIPDDDADDTSTPYRHPGRIYAPRPFDWLESLERMIAGGLTVDDLIRAVHVAQHNNRIKWHETWRYFCGVAWKTLRDRQEAARALLDAGEV